jgi:glycosyltransferase involved in cell wall biosynthesis
MLRCPFSFSCHARDVFVQRTLLKELAALADRATSCNSEAFSVLQNIAPPSCSTSLIRHSVPSLAARQVPAGEQPVILAVGRAVPKKDYRTLFAAFAKIRERFPSTRLIVAGATAQELPFANEGVEALGMVPFPMVASLLEEATVLVHAARVAEDADRDGVPNVILEAMLTGTPVVASDAGAIRDVVRNGETGLLVTSGDIQLLSSAICSVISDSESAAARSDAARALVLERHSEAETIEKLRTFLNS